MEFGVDHQPPMSIQPPLPPLPNRSAGDPFQTERNGNGQMGKKASNNRKGPIPLKAKAKNKTKNISKYGYDNIRQQPQHNNSFGVGTNRGTYQQYKTLCKDYRGYNDYGRDLSNHYGSNPNRQTPGNTPINMELTLTDRQLGIIISLFRIGMPLFPITGMIIMRWDLWSPDIPTNF